jgi:hypothetical protein
MIHMHRSNDFSESSNVRQLSNENYEQAIDKVFKQKSA